MATKKPRQHSRALKRYEKKTRPVSLMGGGQGGFMSSSGNAGSGWG